MKVRRLQYCCRARKRAFDVAGVDDQRVARRLLAHPVVQLTVLWQGYARRPLNLECSRGLGCLPGLLGHDTDKILSDDDFDYTSQSADRCFIHIDHCRTDSRRSHDLAVKHAWYSNVVDEFKSSGGQRRHVQARNWFPENAPLAVWLSFGGATER